MKKAKIKPRPAVKEFEEYFLRRAKRVLKLKKGDFDSYHVEYLSTRQIIKVWLFVDCSVIGHAEFDVAGKRMIE